MEKIWMALLILALALSVVGTVFAMIVFFGVTYQGKQEVLTTHQSQQLSTLTDQVITADHWTYLSNLDQDLSKDAEPTFGTIHTTTPHSFAFVEDTNPVFVGPVAPATVLPMGVVVAPALVLKGAQNFTTDGTLVTYTGTITKTFHFTGILQMGPSFAGGITWLAGNIATIDCFVNGTPINISTFHFPEYSTAAVPTSVPSKNKFVAKTQMVLNQGDTIELGFSIAAVPGPIIVGGYEMIFEGAV